MRVLCVIGTRPEVIKMAPVVQALRSVGISTSILATAQHRQLLDGMFTQFRLSSDWDLDAMRENQGLSSLVGRILPEVDRIICEHDFDLVLAQGDTSTVFAASLAAFHARVPFGHVEAGLRSHNLDAPFPEEGNRRLTGVLASLHFAPTDGAREALLREGVKPSNIHVVGNTVIDSLLWMADRPLAWPSQVPPLEEGQRLVLVTLHRRENFGRPIQRILAELGAFAIRHPDARLVYPVHPNPNVAGPAHDALGTFPNVDLIQPIDYADLVCLLKASHMVLTDSGGLQEEAPALGKPVLVFRDVTERPEAVEAGGVVLVGSDSGKIRHWTDRLWVRGADYRRMAIPRFPYGDGRASERICDQVLGFLARRVREDLT